MRTECLCGCGEPAPLATRFDKRHGYEIGEPKKYIRGHNNPKKKPVRVVDDNTLEIPLTRGYVAWVDSWGPNIDMIQRLQWHAMVRGDNVYAASNTGKGFILLHRLAMQVFSYDPVTVRFKERFADGGSVIDCRHQNLEVIKK